MLTENSIVKGLNGGTYRLGREIGAGGEGVVFAIPGTNLVAKIYRQADSSQEQKLKYMAWNPVPNVVDQNMNPIMTLAWPKDVLYDTNGQFVGYAMPRVEGGVEIFEIERGCTGAAAKAVFPNYTWRLNVQVARNLAAAIMILHRQNYIIGDMNCKNIMVNSDGSISMLDTDSCDVTDQATGRHYKCCVGTEDYLPPELQGVDLRSPRASFTAQTDDFALAVHIFRLLMDNRHPFTCRQLVQPQNSTHQNQLLQNVAQGKCPYIRRIPGFDIPLGAPTLEEIVPDYIQQDFMGTFDYTDSTARSRISSRTTAEKWLADLRRLLQECDTGLVRCNQNPAHFYLRSKGSCGMCAARKRLDDSMGVDPQKLFDRAWAYNQQGNMIEAAKLYRQAADRGHSMAQNSLGICYEKGQGVAQNLSEAVKWYRRAAEQENVCAQYNLGICLFNGKGTEKNAHEAVSWFQKAAAQDDADAQNWLGVCYGRGEGVPKNDVEAVKWYRRAAEKGEMYAQNTLSVRYENGWGVEKNLEQAVNWCRKAAAQGHADARARLPELETQWRHYLLDSSTPSDSQTSRKITLYRPENTKAERWLLILGWALCLFYVICTLGGALYGISRIIRMGTFDELWSIIPFLLMIATYFILPILKRQYCLWHQTIEDWMPSRKLLRGLYALWATVAEVPAFSMAVFPLFQIIPDFPVLDPMIYFFFGAPFFSIYYFACFIWRRRMKKRG